MITTVLASPYLEIISVVSLLLAGVTFVAWKQKHTTGLVYAHLFFLLSPAFLYAISANCQMSLITGLLSWCTMVLTKFVLYFLPSLVLVTFFVGYILIPTLYKSVAKQYNSVQFRKLCKRVGIRARLFIIDRAKPLAFSLGKNVFLSVGMWELLSTKEREAVLLHELAHVQRNAAGNKLSSRIIHVFSPLAWFSSTHSVEAEEQEADAFAIKIQGTNKFLLQAKNKVK